MLAHWISVVVLAGAIAAGVAVSPARKCSNASPGDAKALSARAAALLEEVGPRQAFETFMDPAGEFFPRDLHVLVVDLIGNIWVNGAFPQAIGTNAIAAEDPKGDAYIERMVHIARERGEGRIEYLWIDPCTGDYTNTITYFSRVGPFIVAVGAYGSITAQPAGAETVLSAAPDLSAGASLLPETAGATPATGNVSFAPAPNGR